MRVLLTDGSGLTSRQVALALHASGHEVGVLSSDPFALARWTRAVAHWHAVPSFARDPEAWWRAACVVIDAGGYDVLLPTQEQVVMVAAAASQGRLPRIATAVPSFAALARVQDKASAGGTLDDLGVPQPRSAVLGAARLDDWDAFPAYLKAPIGTASRGVRRVDSRPALTHALALPALREALDDGRLVVQEAVAGPLLMVQAIVDRGRVVALHANERTREGPGGGASGKTSVGTATVRPLVEALAAGLEWHGALSLDVVVDAARGPLVIDVNPRLVEPGNARRSGVDLVGAFLDVATAVPIAPLPDGRVGTRTHQLLLALIAAALTTGRRSAVAAELVAAVRHEGPYAGSAEELTPLAGDPLALVPLAAAVGLAALRPTWASRLVSSSTGAYAATAETWSALGGPG